MLKIAKDLFDLLYPIGTYYETSNPDWTPSSAGWYGTWIQDTKGQTTVSKSDSGIFATLGDNVGSETHRHDFMIGLPFDYMEVVADNLDNAGAYSYSQNKFSKAHNNNYGSAGDLGANASHQTNYKSQTGRIATSTGDTDTAFSIQPSKVVIRWHRTA